MHFNTYFNRYRFRAVRALFRPKLPPADGTLSRRDLQRLVAEMLD